MQITIGEKSVEGIYLTKLRTFAIILQMINPRNLQGEQQECF